MGEAEDPDRVRAIAEDEARTAAAGWLRRQLAEAEKRQERAVAEARRETEERVRAELAEPSASAAVGAERRANAADELEAPEWVPEEPRRETTQAAAAELGPIVSLSGASSEELHGLGMSATQAKRVIRYREERGGFASVDELAAVPGFPREFLDQIRARLTP